MNSSLHDQTTKTFSPGCNNYTLSGETLVRSPFSRSFLIFILLFNLLSCPLIIALNALVMIIVKVKFRLRAQKSNILLATLASTDFMTGLIVQPVFIAKMMTGLLNAPPRWTCLLLSLTKVGLNSFSKVSILHLALLSGERFLALKYPFVHTNIVTASRLLFSSALAWLLPIILRGLVEFGEIAIISLLSNILISVTIVFIISCHLAVYHETRRHQRSISAHQVTPEAREQYEKERKSFNLLIITVSALILCFLPYVVFQLVLFKYASKMSTEHVRMIGDLSISIVLLNSLVNPFIYSVRMKQIRVSIWDLVRGVTGNATVGPEDPN